MSEDGTEKHLVHDHGKQDNDGLNGSNLNGNGVDKTEKELGEEEKQNEEEEEEEEEEPPTLKYTRLTQLPSRFFNKDPISACHFHDSIFIFATHSGFIHLTKTDLTPIRTFRAHRASVLSIHTDGQYVATGSMDGTVVIGSIEDEQDIVAFNFKRPIHAVVLDRQYRVTKSFISGGMAGNVVLSSKNWLGQRNDVVLDSDNGPIVNIQIIDDLIIWMNDRGITIYQLPTKMTLYNIALPKDFKTRPDLYWPKVYFSALNQIVIAWCNYIWFIKVSMTKESETDNKFLSSTSSTFKPSYDKKIEIEKVIALEHDIIAGISQFNNDDIMILNYLLPDEETGISPPPELKLINSDTLEESLDDVIELKNFENLGVNDYHLYQYVDPECKRWFLISANDGVIVEEFNIHDKYQWYLKKHDYLKAWSISEYIVEKLERLNVGLKQMNAFVEANNWKEAAKFLSQILDCIGKDHLDRVKEVWEDWLRIFYKSNKVDDIVDYIPKDDNFGVEKGIYNKYLEYYLDAKQFLKFNELIRNWNHELFDLKYIKNLIEINLKNYDQGDQKDVSEVEIYELRKLFVDLCVELNEYAPAVEHLIKLKDKHLLQFLSENNLIEDFFDQLPEIITLNLSRDEIDLSPLDYLKEKLDDKIEILINNRHKILPQDILNKMEAHNLNLINYLYFEKLFKLDKFLVKNFENDMVKLSASYNRPMLLSFLMKSNNYNIENAIKICESKNYIKELVYLLSKVGQNKKALMLIIDKLNDPEQAINFVTNFNDKELWDYLLDYSMDKPKFIKSLILKAGDTIDPKSIVMRIPEKVEIDDLQNLLINITSNNNMEVLINRRILKIIEAETMSYFDELKNLKLKGYLIDPRDYLKQDWELGPEQEQATFIKFVDESKKTLIKEEQLIGKENIWKSVSTSISQKITHLAYIKEKWALHLSNGNKE